MDLREFIEWYKEAYSSGDMNANAFRQSAAYLDGFSDANSGNEQIQRAANMLRGAANMVDCMHLKMANSNK